MKYLVAAVKLGEYIYKAKQLLPQEADKAANLAGFYSYIEITLLRYLTRAYSFVRHRH